MNNSKMASGDNLINISTDEEKIEREISKDVGDCCDSFDELKEIEEEIVDITQQGEITSEIIQDHETKLKERVAQCKNIIATLKLELHEEKSKLERQTSAAQRHVGEPSQRPPKFRQNETNSLKYLTDVPNSTTSFNFNNLDNTFICDENLIEYEKQLQRYQNTLNMAQIEKKNAIRKQMLAKAYKLKLLELENQCNIELLRVKQSLQCIEPLQSIVNKWKDVKEDSTGDIGNYELIPRYPEFNGNSSSDLTNDCLFIEAPKNQTKSNDPSAYV